MSIQTFGSRIRGGRHFVGLTQRDVADRLGISFTYISKLEHDATNMPSDQLITELAELYGLNTDELFVLAGKVPPDLRMVMSTNLPFVNAVRSLLPTPSEVPAA